MKKIVVSGGYGFIGSNLIKYFLKKKYFVINIDKLSYSSNKYNLEKIPNKKNYIFIKSDIGNRKKIFKVLKKFNPSLFFNLAAETHVDRSIDTPEDFIKNNINSVFNLLETLKTYNKLKKKKIKLIHISTDEVYGDIFNDNIRANENFQYNPSSPYAASKASSDHLVRSYVRTFKLPAIITNCSNNYGPNQNPEKLIPKIIFNILNNLAVPIYGEGKNSREWLHVSDHCRALEVLSLRGKIGESYNIGSGSNLSNLQLIKIIVRLIKKKYKKKTKLIFVKDRPGHDLRYALNSKKIRTKLNWRPKINLMKGLLETIDWYMQNQNYFRNLKGKSHMQRLGLKI